MVHTPEILILDEPTTGLDPQNRNTMWEHIKELNKQGVTIILTTQYLEEADVLCDRIAVIDHGKIRALGTASELKAIVSEGNVLEITSRLDNVEKIASILKSRFKLDTKINGDVVEASLPKDSLRTFRSIVGELAESKVPVLAVSMHLPTLDDVFLKLTGSSMRDSLQENVSEVTKARAYRR